MKGTRDKVERLLDQNAAEQLAKVDWNKLTAEISAGLDQARRAEPNPSFHPVVFRVAAGVAAAAAVLFVIIALTTREPSDVQMPGSPPEATSVADEKEGGLIQIKDASGRILATVQDGRTYKEAVKCNVEIIDRKGDPQADSSRAAWIVISAPRRTFADDGSGREEADLACLL